MLYVFEPTAPLRCENLLLQNPGLNRVRGCPLFEQPTSHTTVRTDRYTAVQPHKCVLRASSYRAGVARHFFSPDIQLPSDFASRRTPLPSANASYYRARSGLSPPSYRPCRAHQKSEPAFGATLQAGPLSFMEQRIPYLNPLILELPHWFSFPP